MRANLKSAESTEPFCQKLSGRKSKILIWFLLQKLCSWIPGYSQKYWLDTAILAAVTTLAHLGWVDLGRGQAAWKARNRVTGAGSNIRK